VGLYLLQRPTELHKNCILELSRSFITGELLATNLLQTSRLLRILATHIHKMCNPKNR